MNWIKVSERLPYTNMRVLVTEEYSTEHGVYHNVGVLDYDAKRKLFVEWDDLEDREIVYNEVTAWMPMPEAYHEE